MTEAQAAAAMPQQMWQYGVLGVVVVVFALVIKHLFKRYEALNSLVLAELKAKEKEIADERSAWNSERIRLATKEFSLRQEFEERHTTLVKDYAKQIVTMQEEARARESATRKENAEIQRQTGEAARHANEALTTLLQKFYERMTSHTPRGF